MLYALQLFLGWAVFFLVVGFVALGLILYLKGREGDEWDSGRYLSSARSSFSCAGVLALMWVLFFMFANLDPYISDYGTLKTTDLNTYVNNYTYQPILYETTDLAFQFPAINRALVGIFVSGLVGVVVTVIIVSIVRHIQRNRRKKNRREEMLQSEAVEQHKAQSINNDITTKLEAAQTNINTYPLYWTQGIEEALTKLIAYSKSARPMTAKIKGDIDYLLQEFNSVNESYKTFSTYATTDLYQEALVKIHERVNLLESSLNQILDSLMVGEMLELKVSTDMLSQHNMLNSQEGSPFTGVALAGGTHLNKN